MWWLWLCLLHGAFGCQWDKTTYAVLPCALRDCGGVSSQESKLCVSSSSWKGSVDCAVRYAPLKLEELRGVGHGVNVDRVLMEEGTRPSTGSLQNVGDVHEDNELGANHGRKNG